MEVLWFLLGTVISFLITFAVLYLLSKKKNYSAIKISVGEISTHNQEKPDRLKE